MRIFGSEEEMYCSVDEIVYRSASIIELVESAEYIMFTGSRNKIPYIASINKSKMNAWKLCLMDFIGYSEKRLDREVIVIGKEKDVELASQLYRNQSYDDIYLRENEPKLFIHSTTEQAWDLIKECGKLLSWKRVKELNLTDEDKPIGSLLGDPIEFSNYIMLGHGLSIASEYVVASKREGKIICRSNESYVPGIRIYLDGEKIAADGKLIRDGLHYKVEHELDIEEYLVRVLTTRDLPTHEVWTPRLFAEECNRVVERENNSFD